MRMSLDQIHRALVRGLSKHGKSGCKDCRKISTNLVTGPPFYSTTPLPVSFLLEPFGFWCQFQTPHLLAASPTTFSAHPLPCNDLFFLTFSFISHPNHVHVCQNPVRPRLKQFFKNIAASFLLLSIHSQIFFSLK